MLPIFLIICLKFAHSELFTSLASLEQILLTERQMIEIMENHIKSGPAESPVPRVLEKMRKLEKKPNFDDPIEAFLHIKTAFQALEYLKETKSDSYKKALRLHQPTYEDVDGAAMALFRLQDTYQIPAEDFGAQLAVDDCFMLGYVAMRHESFYHMIPWLRIAEIKLKRESLTTKTPTLKYFNETLLYDYLAYALREQDNFEWALWYTRKLRNTEPNHINADNVEWYEDELEYANSNWDGTESKLPAIKNPRPLKNVYLQYEALCRGENQKMTENMRKGLHCFYKKDKAFLKLAPIKIELLFQDPEIYLFKEVISDSEIDSLMKLAKPKLRRAQVVDPDADDWSQSTKNTIASFRVAQNMWINDTDDRVVASISQRVVDMTGLSVEYAESLQIANYGLGGHYEPHYDMITDRKLKNETHGNRIATVLFYLSEPEYGGATVFDDLGVTIYASKNDAAFWFNLDRDGEPAWSTRHAGCPVLYGRKWVANKWLHEFGQEFRWPCGLQPNQKLKDFSE